MRKESAIMKNMGLIGNGRKDGKSNGKIKNERNSGTNLIKIE